MKDNISPEEKLLRLIRGQKKQATPPDKKTQGLPAPVSIDSKTNFTAPLSYQVKKYFPFLSIRKIIPVFFVVSCIYLAASFIYPGLGFKEIKFHETGYKKISLPELEETDKVKTYEFYLEGIKNKTIFSTAPEEQETAESYGSANLEEIKDISLVGIITGENPQAVLEDKKEQRTYYLTKGQYIGAFQVEDIQEGKVILSYKNKNYELYI